MLSFFRINSFFQIFVVLLSVILLSILFISSDIPLLSTELEWMLIGEKLNENLVLYKEVLTQVAPFSAYTYKILDLLFVNVRLAFNVMAVAVTCLQIVLFSFMIKNRKLFNENNFFAGFIYAVISFISFDVMKLSPALMATTFLILAMNAILKQLERRDGVGDEVFEVGLFIGIATLFHHPTFVFIIWALLVLFFYTGVGIKQVFMVIVAFLIPIIATYFIFQFSNSGKEFQEIWLFNFNNFVRFSWLNVRDIILVFFIPVSLSLLGLAKVLNGNRYNNYQNRSHQSILIFGIFSIIAFILSGKYLPTNLIYFFIPLAFYISGFILHLKRIIWAEAVIIIFALAVFALSYISLTTNLGLNSPFLSDYIVKKTNIYDKYAGKRIFITGRNIDGYESNKMATGYLSWNLAKKDFENPNNFLSISNIYNNFIKDLPEVIIDEENVMPAVFENIPNLTNRYRQIDERIYELK